MGSVPRHCPTTGVALSASSGRLTRSPNAPVTRPAVPNTNLNFPNRDYIRMYRWRAQGAWVVYRVTNVSIWRDDVLRRIVGPDNGDNWSFRPHIMQMLSVHPLFVGSYTYKIYFICLGLYVGVRSKSFDILRVVACCMLQFCYNIGKLRAARQWIEWLATDIIGK